MVHTDRVTPELIAMYEIPFELASDGGPTSGRHAPCAPIDIATRMVEVEALNIPTLVPWGAQDILRPITYGERQDIRAREGRLYADHGSQPLLAGRRAGESRRAHLRIPRSGVAGERRYVRAEASMGGRIGEG